MSAIPAPPRLALERRDYVSPGLAPVAPDAAFPHMTPGDADAHPWPYLRREVPHLWWVDGRAPGVGFLSRDEAHILYNTALQFRGEDALEVGCWLGWSACHLALAGVRLDVVDPLLADPGMRGSVSTSLRLAGVGDRVRLHAGSSPARVDELAAERGVPWSLIFIDGDHTRPAPARDAEACARHAAADALILLHDLAAPDVAEALDLLQAQGWHTMVYQTMQIMGVAWRGAVEPVRHLPDPAVAWTLPDFLRRHPLSGGPAPVR